MLYIYIYVYQFTKALLHFLPPCQAGAAIAMVLTATVFLHLVRLCKDSHVGCCRPKRVLGLGFRRCRGRRKRVSDGWQSK